MKPWISAAVLAALVGGLTPAAQAPPSSSALPVGPNAVAWPPSLSDATTPLVRSQAIDWDIPFDHRVDSTRPAYRFGDSPYLRFLRALETTPRLRAISETSPRIRPQP